MPSKSPLSTKASDFLNQITQLKEIIPAGGDLSTRLLRGCYKRVLSDLEGIITAEDEPVKLATRLKGYLSDHWDLIKGTSLSYTSIPEDRLTGLLVDIASFVAETIEGSEDEPLYPLTVLMPTVAVESLVDDKDYPSLNELALQEVLRTHILGKEGSYLVPVRQLIDLQEKPKNEWYNTYYDYKTPSKETALLSPEDYEQLGNHSSYTKALIEAKAQYELSLKEQGSLLYHLRELSSKLYFNSVLGVGIEENAGTGTYDAIIQFNDYYSKLDEVSKEKIPPAVKQEIDLLLTLSSDSTKNIKATSQIETCIKIRRESLVAAITPQEQVLSEIGLTKKTAETLCAEKKAQLLSCQNELKIAIEKKKYQGIDKRGLTLELFKTLQVDIAISSAADLQEIVKLSPSELDSLFKNIALQKQFVDQFESLEMLVLFIHQTPIPKLQVLLKHCGQSLANKFILKPGDLSVLLISLDAERVSLIISMMMGKIKNAYDFVDLIENLSLEQSLLVCNALKEKLHDIIKTVSDFKYILVSLSSEQGALVFELIEHQLLNLIKTGEDFGIALAALAPEQHVLLFKAIKHKLPDLINTAIDFTCVVNYLYLEEMSFVFEAIKDRLPKLITNARDFHRILKNPFSKEQGAFILKIVEDKLPELVNTLADFELVVNYLSPEQIVFLCQGISKISVVINDIHDFKHLLKAASLEQFYPLCKTLMDKAPWLLRTGDDFCELITISPQEKQAFIFDLIKDKLPEIINDAHHVKIALRHLSLTQRAVLLALMKEKWVAIIKTADDFSDLLEFLSLEEKTDLFDLMKKRLPNLIKTARDYVNITEYLSSEQNSTILGLMQDKLPAIIEKVDDFIAVTACTESHDFLFKVMKSEFAFLIKNSKELNKLMNALSEEERIDLCKYELPLCRVIVNVGRDVPKITDLFQTPEGKRHFQHSYFKSLLAEIELDNNLKIQKSNLFCLQKNVASYFADKIPLSDFKEGVLMVIKELTEYSGKENYRPVILSKWKSAIITLEKTGAEVSPVDKLKNSKYDFQFFQSPKNTVAEELIPESTDRDEYGFHNSQ